MPRCCGRLLAGAHHHHNRPTSPRRLPWRPPPWEGLLMATTILLMLPPLSIKADESSIPGTNSLDLHALAQLAGNPQVVNLVSGFLKSQGGTLDNNPPGPQSDSDNPNQNSLLTTNPDNYNPSNGGGQAAGEPLKRNPKGGSNQAPAQTPPPPLPPQQQQQPQQQQPPPSPLSGGLASMLSNLLPNLNLNNVSTILSMAMPKSSNMLAKTLHLEPSPVTSQTAYSGLTSTTTVAPGAVSGKDGVGSAAHATMGQVLAAFASGQIPGELIQMALTGKIPAAIIDLALSGQVPAQLIQMVVTGQIPINTIKAFLGSTTEAPSAGYSNGTTGKPSPSSMARAWLADVFKLNQNHDGSRTISVPTLLGPVPVQLPTLPKVRHIGQMVGGTISNVAALLPF